VGLDLNAVGRARATRGWVRLLRPSVAGLARRAAVAARIIAARVIAVPGASAGGAVALARVRARVRAWSPAPRPAPSAPLDGVDDLAAGDRREDDHLGAPRIHEDGSHHAHDHRRDHGRILS
jgi:hypothetical protein